MLDRFCVHIEWQNPCLTILNVYMNDSRFRFYVGSILCSYMVSKSILDHFEIWTYISAPFLCWIDFVCIYSVKIYVGSILCSYIESESIFDHFELICGCAPERYNLGVRRNATIFLSRPSYPPTPTSPIRDTQAHSHGWSLNTQAYQLLGKNPIKFHENLMNLLTGWRVDRLTGWQVDGLTGWRVDRLTGWRVDRLTGWQVDGLMRS